MGQSEVLKRLVRVSLALIFLPKRTVISSLQPLRRFPTFARFRSGVPGAPLAS